MVVFGSRFGRMSLLASAAIAAVASAAPAMAQEVRNGRDETSEADVVVVSAQRQDESILDVPMAVTALNGEQLSDQQSYRFEDYAGKIPGLTTTGNGGFGTQLTIRGLTTGVYTINSSVATYVDETPYTSNGSAGLSGSIAPVLEAFDMQRVEVLRGPQGTLYGANAMGGLLKYVTNAPDPSGFAARLDAGLASVEGGGTDYNLHAMVNLPFGDTAALRLVGYDNRYPGFVDDALRGVADVNSSRSWGGRASFLFEATSDLTVRLSAAYQDRSWDDFPNVDVTPGALEPINGLTQSNLVGSPGTVKNQVYNATVDWNLGFAKLISSSNYIEYASDVGFDVSDTFGTFLSTSVFPLFGLDVCTFSPPFTPCGVGVVPPFFQVIAGP